MTYEVEMQDESIITIEGVEDFVQVFGFLKFHNDENDLIIAIRADLIKTFKPGVRTFKPSTINISKPTKRRVK